MPIGSCEHCEHRFVIEAADSPQRICPCCLRPMQMTSLAALRSDLSTCSADTRAAGSAAFRTGTDFAAWLGDHPLGVDALGQRVLKALSQAACVCREAAEARAAAQATRQRRG
jgi:hypothetical protein